MAAKQRIEKVSAILRYHVVRLMPGPSYEGFEDKADFKETIRKMDSNVKRARKKAGDEVMVNFVYSYSSNYTLCTGGRIHMLLTVAPPKTLPSASLFKAKPAASRCVFQTLDSLRSLISLKNCMSCRQHYCGEGELPKCTRSRHSLDATDGPQVCCLWDGGKP